MLSKSLLLMLTAAAAIYAAPVPEELERRVCGSVIMPRTLIQLKQSRPTTSFPNTEKTDNSFFVYQDVNGATGKVADKVNQLVAFTGPVGAYGCTLGITFPSDYHFPTWTGAAPTLDIYTVPKPLPNSPTYNNIKPTRLFGTVTVRAG